MHVSQWAWLFIKIRSAYATFSFAVDLIVLFLSCGPSDLYQIFDPL